MKQNIMVAGSYPMVITSGGQPRVNKDNIDNIFLKKYISLFGELLKVKGNSKDIKITYIGGYSNEENTSRSKLYISAFNYYLNSLGYDSLSKENLTVFKENEIDASIDGLEQCDLLILGIGSDKVFANNIEKLEQKKIFLNELIEKNNLLVFSICSGSVMSAQQILGSMYDTFYYQTEKFDCPTNIFSLSINPITMETDFLPNDATDEQNLKFTEEYLKEDSYKTSFFACRPNSFFLIGENAIYSYGEIFLFMDGKSYLIENEQENANVSELVKFVQQYNQIKNKNKIINDELVRNIELLLSNLEKKPITNEVLVEENEIITEFKINEQKKNNLNQEYSIMCKNNLKNELDCLFSLENREKFANDLELQARFKALNSDIFNSYNIKDPTESIEELYLKMNIVSLIKKAYLQYYGYYSDFKNMLYSFLEERLLDNQLLVYYFVDTCGSLFTNREVKGLLKNITIDGLRRPQVIIDSTQERQMLFKKEWKYERS